MNHINLEGKPSYTAFNRHERKHLLTFFTATCNIGISPCQDTIDAGDKFESSLKSNLLPENVLNSNLLYAISRKTKINEEANRNILAYCAKYKITMPAASKSNLTKALNSRHSNSIIEIIGEECYTKLNISSTLKTDDQIIYHFKEVIKNPINRRTKKLDYTLSANIVSAIYAEFVFLSVPLKVAKEYFFGKQLLDEKYFEHCSNHSDGFEQCSPSCLIGLVDNESPKDEIEGIISTAYKTLRNHSYLIIIHDSKQRTNAEFWSSIENAKLLAEKGFHSILKYKFLTNKDACKTVEDHLGINIQNSELSFIGFSYLDTFVVDNLELSSESNYAVQVFEINKFDETKIPCPACHSINVEGNSYSKIGVKSWECKNPICGNRSQSNRGNRYSFYSTLRNQASLNIKNEISRGLIKEWNRDIVCDKNLNHILHMCASFFSSTTDQIALTHKKLLSASLNRSTVLVEKHDHFDLKSSVDLYKRRFTPPQLSPIPKHKTYPSTIMGNHKLILGDSSLVLSNFPDNHFSAAVTSPPYFNAREYSQWENIYCYYGDMIKNARQVYRTLVNGGVYAFNIFDYFDNEKDIATSALGNKRLIISSVLTSCFQDIGFNLLTNIVWDKGHIEGKRGFNGGNNTPFYQMPFNCWEHILVFSKGSPHEKFANLPKIIQQPAYIKIIRGVNTLGHTAPFPTEIPELITSCLLENDIVLDPYGGSGTTSIAASNYNVSSVIIEKEPDYYSLAQTRLNSSLNCSKSV